MPNGMSRDSRSAFDGIYNGRLSLGIKDTERMRMIYIYKFGGSGGVAACQHLMI